MQEFTIQVLATLVSTLIIFCITKFVKWIRTIPINFWYNLFFKITIFAAYLLDANNLIINIRLLISATKFSFMYILALMSFSLCFYSTVDLSIFIKNKFFDKKFYK